MKALVQASECAHNCIRDHNDTFVIWGHTSSSTSQCTPLLVRSVQGLEDGLELGPELEPRLELELELELEPELEQQPKPEELELQWKQQQPKPEELEPQASQLNSSVCIGTLGQNDTLQERTSYTMGCQGVCTLSHHMIAFRVAEASFGRG